MVNKVALVFLDDGQNQLVLSCVVCPLMPLKLMAEQYTERNVVQLTLIMCLDNSFGQFRIASNSIYRLDKQLIL